MEPSSAYHQILYLSVVFFCGPGLYSALSSIASGLQDPTLAFRGNVLVYASFALSSIVASALVPSMGLRLSLSVGTSGYVLYALSLWDVSSAQIPSAEAATTAFYISSVVLGIAAGFLWTAQGQMIMSYATEANQGRYLSTFWIIFNLGAAGGGLVTCILNWNLPRETTNRQAVSAATYFAYTMITVIGMVIAWMCIVPPSRVLKEGGDCVVSQTACGGRHARKNWYTTAAADLAKYLATSRKILLLLPFLVYSNWFYTYHSFFNVSIFNTRSSGAASACYWTAQMLAAHWFGGFLDTTVSSSTSSSISSLHCQQRHHCAAAMAWRVLVGLAILWNIMWATGWYAQTTLQLSYETPLLLDIAKHPLNSMGPLVLYCVYGGGDALGQIWIYWYLSSVCPSGRDLRVAGYNAGLYKSVQSLSAALSWYIGAQRVSPVQQVWGNWLLSNLALVGAFLSLQSRQRSVDLVEKEQGREDEHGPFLRPIAQYDSIITHT